MATVTIDSTLSGVLGDRTAKAIEKAFGYRTVGELLGHAPRRYALRGEPTPIAQLPLHQPVTVIAEVRRATSRAMRGRKGTLLEVELTDGRGSLTLTFFNQAWRADQLVPGARGLFAGKVTLFQGKRQLSHPDYELFEDIGGTPEERAEAAKRWAETPIPIYPATGTVASWQLQRAIGVVLDVLDAYPDPVPPALREQHQLLDALTAIRQLHRPEHAAAWKQAQATLRYHEAFLLQLALLQQRAERRSQRAAPRRSGAKGVLERFDAALPFPLTPDQRSVGDEVQAELAGEIPMHRLVQGEVGSGKTLVALRAMLAVAESGGQSALLAPTEVLAAQHFRSITRTLGPQLCAELMPVLLTGQMSAAERKHAMLRIVGGNAKIVVGTHALLGDKVHFYDLGLVVVDEQHRFGVEQREALRLKAQTPPHLLVLTATPIPRTVAMTVFGDLDVSTIRTMPAGRAGIDSFTVPLADKPGWAQRIWQRVAEEVAAGRQAFVVCPAISAAQAEEGSVLTGEPLLSADGTETAPAASVESVLAELRALPALAGLRIEALHGKLASDEKDRIMTEFAAGRIDVLVSTTVIEVGVDVPNASTMVVLDADRFGVSQLHQLRGRVGRGEHKGLALFVTRAEVGTLARERVDAVAATLDGFELAQKDLELRREGDVLGEAQSGGRSSLKLLRVLQDADLIAEARQDAAALLEADPTLVNHPGVAAALARRLDEHERSFLAKA